MNTLEHKKEDILISPRNIKGKVLVPPSKSLCHRAIICAALAQGHSVIRNVGSSEDISATIQAVKAFGAEVEKHNEVLTVKGMKKIESAVIDCNESGSTLRFLIPLALHTESTEFRGSGRLMERPLDVYYDIFDKCGIDYKKEGATLIVKGGRLDNDIEIDGGVSSQFISGLLMTLPLFEHDTCIKMTTPLQSKAYVDLTIDVMKAFGVEVKNDSYNEFIVKGGQAYMPCEYICEGDFSQAAFYLVAGAIGNDVACLGLDPYSRQGDRAIIDILERMGGCVEVCEDYIKALPAQTHGITIDASQIPDLVPILAVLGALSHGETTIINAQRLRIKESDRLEAITRQLSLLGANIRETADGLIIEGIKDLKGGITDGCNDHRIAMSIAIASTRAVGDVCVKGSQCVNKSYIQFWDDFKSLGGKCCDW